MKINPILLTIGLSWIIALTIVGCSDNPTVHEQQKYITQINGRPLYRMTVTSQQAGWHYIYYFDDTTNQPISVNYDAGKITEVIVLVNGKPVVTNRITLEDVR